MVRKRKKPELFSLVLKSVKRFSDSPGFTDRQVIDELSSLLKTIPQKNLKPRNINALVRTVLKSEVQGGALLYRSGLYTKVSKEKKSPKLRKRNLRVNKLKRKKPRRNRYVPKRKTKPRKLTRKNNKSLAVQRATGIVRATIKTQRKKKLIEGLKIRPKRGIFVSHRTKVGEDDAKKFNNQFNPEPMITEEPTSTTVENSKKQNGSSRSNLQKSEAMEDTPAETVMFSSKKHRKINKKKSAAKFVEKK